MSDDVVLTERHDDGIAVIRLNRPPMNALSRAVLGSLRDSARELGDDAAGGWETEPHRPADPPARRVRWKVNPPVATGQTYSMRCGWGLLVRAGVADRPESEGDR